MIECLDFRDRRIEPSFSGCESPGDPARDFPLKAHDLHVWIVDVRRILAPDGELSSLLSKDEFQRWRRFHFPGDRRRFLVARSLLRTLLGRYLAADPQSIRFEYNQYGKPGLRGEFLSFNLSHSHNLILYGLALHEALGVDVERINPDFGTREIAERFFSPHEIEELRGLPVDQQVLGFFNCWTRKEAFIKALGRGLSVPLDSFDVTLAPAEPSRLLATREDSRVRDSWKLYSTEPAPGYVGAICAGGRVRRLRFFQYQQENDQTL